MTLANQQPSRDVIYVYVREVRRQMDKISIEHYDHTDEEIWAAVMEIAQRGYGMAQRFKKLHNLDPESDEAHIRVPYRPGDIAGLFRKDKETITSGLLPKLRVL